MSSDHLGCFERAGVGLSSGIIFGGLYGSVLGAWATPMSETSGLNVAKTPNAEFLKSMGLVGRNALIFGTVALAFTSTRCLAETVRQKNDPINSMIGGASTGAIVGFASTAGRGRMDIVAGTALGMGLFCLCLDAAGADMAQDKEFLRNRRFANP